MSTGRVQKNKRGNRGGSAKKIKAEAEAALSSPAAGVVPSPANDTLPSTATETVSAPETSQEPPKKKTRRGGQGKKAAAVVAEGPNAIEVGSGHTQEERTSWEEWKYPQHDHGYHSSPQPYFPPMAPDEHHYFITMEKELDEKEFEDAEEKTLFVAAMFRELDGKEASVAADPDCSRVLEKMLRASNDFRLRVFADRLNGQWAQLFRHQFASHVCQTVMYLAADVVDREMKGESIIDVPEEEKQLIDTLPTMQKSILDVCEQLSEEWNQLIVDQYASHLVRALLTVLSGEPLSQNEGDRRSKKSQKYNSEHKNTWKETQPVRRGPAGKRMVPATFATTLAAITTSVSAHINGPELRSFALHPVANPVLQMLISFPETSASLQNTILGVEDANTAILTADSFITDLLVHPVGSHLMERLLAAAPPHLFHQLYVTYFRTRLLELCAHPVANFVVQHLIVNTRNATQLEVLLDELLPSFDDLLWRNRAGVVVKIAETCVKHQTCQKEVIKSICTAFHVATLDQRRQLVSLVLAMQPMERYDVQRPPNLHGSLLLQQLLLFDEEHNKVVIDSFMALTPDESQLWTVDAVASRVIEQFLLSNAVSIKAKRKVVRGLLGRFSSIATERFGSHVVDKAWAVADIALKEKIAEDLLTSYNKLSNDYFGKYVLRNCKIDSFKRRREEWVEKEMGIERKKDMFKDFLTDEPNAKASDSTASDKVKKGKKEVDPLWTTHKFDEGMAALGFGGGKVEAAPSKDKKAKKAGKKDKVTSKAAQEYEDMEKLALKDDDDPALTGAAAGGSPEEGEPASLISKASKDEIENLFSKTKKRARDERTNASNSHERAAPDSDDGSDGSGDDNTGAAAAAPPSGKKVGKDLAGVLDAISATKKRKKSKPAKEEVKAKKDAEGGKRKRKFEA
ncbi:Nucleolar protein 9 [Geranomyces variabilis]|uniref:Nucleolar protein 9 n=1 Tax=Geranomyces variabilis TaxID=109894 RepID=A0AAD5XNZ0_9FUNG|nr:Nucleolar protein 9 [Geranomyces variabilis]